MHSRAESDIYMCEPPRPGAATLCLSRVSRDGEYRPGFGIGYKTYYSKSVCS